MGRTGTVGSWPSTVGGAGRLLGIWLVSNLPRTLSRVKATIDEVRPPCTPSPLSHCPGPSWTWQVRVEEDLAPQTALAEGLGTSFVINRKSLCGLSVLYTVTFLPCLERAWDLRTGHQNTFPLYLWLLCRPGVSSIDAWSPHSPQESRLPFSLLSQNTQHPELKEETFIWPSVCRISVPGWLDPRQCSRVEGVTEERVHSRVGGSGGGSSSKEPVLPLFSSTIY